MGNFAVNANQELVERGKRVLDRYKKEGETQADALARIFDLAEQEEVRGTHPELAGSLRSIDSTIATLVKQLNGLASGQDGKIEELRNMLEKTAEERDAAKEEAEKARALSAQAAKEKNEAIKERDTAKRAAEDQTKINSLLAQQVAGTEDLKAQVKDLMEQNRLLREKLDQTTDEFMQYLKKEKEEA